MATSIDSDQLPLVVICGPTASGKTALAIKLAQEFGGEIISADSRAIYRGLDIGTAKPSLEEQKLVPQWGIDIVDPDERFTAVDFKVYATNKIAEIRARNKIPFLVGGTGLYIDSVIYDYQFPDESARSLLLRKSLEEQSIDSLHEYCESHNISLPENYKNKRYVINAILNKDSQPARRKTIIENCIVVGITTDKEVLRERIKSRADIIFTTNIIEEAHSVANKYGWNTEAMTGNIYPLIKRHLDGELSIDEAKQLFNILDWRLAKRQVTWLKRNSAIKWFNLETAYTYCARELANLNNS